MIRVVLVEPAELEVAALLRSVGTDLEACTSVGARVGAEAGEAVLVRLRGFGELPIGAAVVTPGGRLPAPLLIHVVVRSSIDPISEARVERAFRSGLRQATEWGVESLGVPPLGVGAGNLDAEVSARVMCAVLRDHLERNPLPREVVVAVASCYEEDVFTREVSRVFPDEVARHADRARGSGGESEPRGGERGRGEP